MIRQRLDPGAYVEETPWLQWLQNHFAHYITAPFADRHLRFWEWVSALQPAVRPRPRVEVWPRGGGKSSTIEMGCAYIGSAPHPSRHFVLYVSETQVQANVHVQAVANMLERVGVKRAVNQYGSSRGWTQTQVRAMNGFNIQAFGLDAGMRGIKLDEFRPDVIVMDDIDGRHDTAEITAKKIEVITQSILPAGSIDCAFIVVQNKIAKDSIVSRLCDDRADFLLDRIPATVEPAVTDLKIEQQEQEDGSLKYVIAGGTATWDGQSLDTCAEQINSWGRGAFMREAQHEVDDVEGGLWDRLRDIEPYRLKQGEEVPELDVIAVGIDPNTNGKGDEAGIIVAGISRKWRDYWHDKPHAYILADLTVGGGPKKWADAAVAAYHDYRADYLIAEVNNGGDMVKITIETVDAAPPVTMVWASRGKRTRAEPIQKLSEEGRITHVKPFPELEQQLCGWDPSGRAKSPDRLDAYVWVLSALLLGGANDESGSVVEEMNQELAWLR